MLEITIADYCIYPQPDRLKWNISSPLKFFEYMASSKPIIFTPKPFHKNKLADQDYIVPSKEDQIENYVDAIKRAFDNREFLDSRARIAPVIIKINRAWYVQC